MLTMAPQENYDDDLVIFEIVVDNLKFELDKILKSNENYKTDYYTYNRKKFLLTNYINAQTEFEQNAYINEIREISKYSNYNYGIEKATNVILSTIKIVTNKSNTLLDGLKYKNQTYYHIVNNHSDTNNHPNCLNMESHNTTNLNDQLTWSQSATFSVNSDIINVNQIQSHGAHLKRKSNSEMINNSYTSSQESTFNQSDHHISASLSLASNTRSENELSKDAKRFKCETCSKTFKLKHQLNRHIRVHTGEKPNICEFCGKAFSDESNFNSHLRYHTNDLPHECEVCKKRFITKSHLNLHLRIHSGEKPYKCEVCGREFTSKESMIRHTSIHTGLKPFECEVCKKTFRQKKSMTEHLKIHSSDKQFECMECKKKFTLKAQLTLHSRIHTGVKPYECKICNQFFRHYGTLKGHLRIHSGEKPYECEICKQSFRHFPTYSTHLKVHKKVINCKNESQQNESEKHQNVNEKYDSEELEKKMESETQNIEPKSYQDQLNENELQNETRSNELNTKNQIRDKIEDELKLNGKKFQVTERNRRKVKLNFTKLKS